MSRVLIVGALPESLLNFRGDLLKALISAGHEVTAMSALPEPAVIAKISKIGVSFKSFPVQRHGMNPIKDLQTYFALRRVFCELKPDVILAYTIKPVIWGGLASRSVSTVRMYALIEGLGFAFQGGSIRRNIIGHIASLLYKSALFKASRIIFLNPDNRESFLMRGLVTESKTTIIDGIGLDLDWYSPAKLPVYGIVFLTIARLLGEKGLREYARAAALVKQRYPDTEFRLVGQTDPSPDGIPLEEVMRWESEFGVKYLGATNDVRPFLADCHVYVLPSYHEGMPRTVLEAMSIGRPILTTDVPGCRETVVSGENGYLVSKQNAEELAERMIWFIENRDQWDRMGQASRRIAEERFDVHKINAQMLSIMGLSAAGGHETSI